MAPVERDEAYALRRQETSVAVDERDRERRVNVQKAAITIDKYTAAHDDITL